MENSISTKILVYGSTVGGIGAAIAAARAGLDVVLIERGNHFGGMAASGLGMIDLLRKNAVGGLCKEFLDHVEQHYKGTYGPNSEQLRLTYSSLFMEPHIAEGIFNQMLSAEKHLTTYKRHELVEVIKREQTVIASVYKNRDTGDLLRVEHQVAIDGTYEGDVAAAAGVAYRIAREGRKEYDERYAGHIYYDQRYNRQEILPQSTGEPSEHIQAYCFRLTVCDDPDKRIPFEKPASYNDFYPMYKPIIEDFRNGRLRKFRDTMWINPIPNRLNTCNGHIEALTSMNLAEFNMDWSDGNWETRDRIFETYKQWTLGLWYFMLNDPAIPRVPKVEGGCFGLPTDEYADCDHFPWQLYVRQARRIIGEYVLREQDCLSAPGRERPYTPKDAIAISEHAFDAHPCRNRAKDTIALTADGFELLEGTIHVRNSNMLQAMNRPTSLPYRIIVPEKIDGLLVPVAMSATHVAYTGLRMEPIWMSTGQAAGVAAAQAIQAGKAVRAIDIHRLQETLAGQGQVMVYFPDLALDAPDFKAVQLRAIAEDYPSFQLAGVRAG